MMHDDQVQRVLADLLRRQTLAPGGLEETALRDEAGSVEKLLLGQLSNSSPRIKIGGSLAKGTLVRASYDLDLVCCFDNDDAGAGKSLEEIYAAVRGALNKDYTTSEKRSAVRLITRKGIAPDLGFTVDVLPGRLVDDSRADMFLHQTEGDKQRLKTNPWKHIAYVQQSGFVETIRLAKLWKLAASLDVKTFVLELLVIDGLGKSPPAGFGAQLLAFWGRLRDEVDTLKVEDPANPTGNDLSIVFGDAEKEALAAAAKVAIDMAEGGSWLEVLGDSAREKAAGAGLQESLQLGDMSHAIRPTWPSATGFAGRVVVHGFARRPSGRWRKIESDRGIITDGAELRFDAATTVPPPFEIHWQVVNTGDHAREEGGLRGHEFFRSRGLDHQPSSQPLSTYERAEYTGKHWIEGFVVKDGRLAARSGKFLVNFVNRRRRWWRQQ